LLFIDDDQHLARLTTRYLESHDIDVTWVDNGESGLARLIHGAFDVVLLDVMLPGIDGIGVCREIRARSDVPVLMLTALGDEADRVNGLEIGADDYIRKPFSSRELLARLRAQVRRARGRCGPSGRFLTAGSLRIDLGAMEVTVDGRPVSLTSYEFALLRALAEQPGRVMSREQLMDVARGNAEDAFDRSIDVHISRLRQKLEPDPRHPSLLKTVRGVGYMVADPALAGDD
jgi:DNA-binding response OmpR family regulator